MASSLRCACLASTCLRALRAIRLHGPDDERHDPLFRLMERMCRLGEQLPSEEEVLHDENALHRAMMLVAEMRKIDKEVRAMGKRERERRAGRASS